MHRIHCVCEDWTATGRVSVSDPNLIGINKDFVIKNITLEDNAGEQSTTDDSTNGISFSLRRMLIASKDHVLVSADFSQLELRILAHLSGDKDLQKVLNDDGDVFKNIAASWKMKSIELVTKDERQQAKQVCIKFYILFSLLIQLLIYIYFNSRSVMA
jgi:DNA polymerase I-like protein with 3'-5' exonuclease and polymerase domains